MTKENHYASFIARRLNPWQKKLRMLSSLVPTRKLPLLTPAEAFGPDVERFHDSSQALVPWRDKQSQSWSFHGILKNSKGRPFGFQLSFVDRHTQNDFIGAIPARWLTNRSFAAHFAVTDPVNAEKSRAFRYWQRGGLLSTSSGFAAEDRFHVELDAWHAYQREDGILVVYANGDGDSLHLELQSLKQMAYHGQSGYLQRGPGSGDSAFSCSLTRMQASGWLLIDGRLEDITGFAWMDHEKFTSPNEAICDSISMQFQDGGELRLSLSHDPNGEPSKFTSGTWIDSNGAITHLIHSDIAVENIEKWISPRTNARYPVKRKIRIEPLDLDLQIKPAVPEQELDKFRTVFASHWQGMIAASGFRAGRPIEAQGFMNLSGYDQRPRAQIAEFLMRR